MISAFSLVVLCNRGFTIPCCLRSLLELIETTFIAGPAVKPSEGGPLESRDDTLVGSFDTDMADGVI